MRVLETLPVYTRAGLLVVTALVGGIVASTPARAQDAATLRAIQAQISQLQAQLKQLQRQAAERDAELKRARADSAQAKADASRAVERASTAPPPAQAVLAAPPGSLPLTVKAPATPDDPVKTIQLGGVQITLGGFVDLTGIVRSRNLTAGPGTPFNSIPFNNNPNAHTGEFRASAQATRLNFLVEGKPTTTLNLAAFVEADFLGAATTANSNQSNSYTPRLRHAYIQADESDYGLHVLAGQTWSLATGFTTGMTPRKEAILMTADHNYAPGFVYTRAPQLRIVKDFGQKYWLGLSLETPQALYGFSPTTASGARLPGVDNSTVGATVTYNNPGTTFLNSGTNYSIDVAPDIIAKAAADTRFGHYEVYGLGRWFKTRTAFVGGTAQDQIAFGGGVGGSLYVPVWPKYIELSGDVLGGYGTGRYGAAQLPDVSFKGNGEPAPLPSISANIGLIGHPAKSVDLYTYFGTEQVGRSTYTSGSTKAGYGSATVNVAGCEIETGTVATAPTCNAQTRSLWNISAGGWWRFAHGSYGTLLAGLQYSYTKRTAFHGAANASGSLGATPKTDENVGFFTLRYLPFQ